MSVLSLIPFDLPHAERLRSWFSSEAALVQWGGPAVAFPLDTAQLAAMLEDSRRDPPVRLCWSAVARGELVGHAQLALDRRNGNGRLARIALAPDQRGKGLSQPLVTRVVQAAFEMAWIERLELNVYAFNTPAIRAYERAGFVVEGNRRSSALVGGERWDTLMMGLLRSDWRAL